MDAYGVDGTHGWAWEGVGMYLVYHLVGTRMTYFIDRTDYARRNQFTLWPRMQDPRTNWLQEAHGLLKAGRAPRLEFLIGRSVDTMRDEDVLVSYALAAYLLEGRPGDLPVILRRIGAGEHPVQVLEKVMGLPVQRIQERFVRWLDEVLALRGVLSTQD